MRKLIYILLLISLSGCAQTELQDVEPIGEHLQDQYKVSRSDILGAWFTDIESCGQPGCLLVSPYIIIEPIGSNKALINGDTVLMTSASSYVGATVFNTLTSGQIIGGELQHCELYADYSTQTSYYVCVLYKR